MHSLILPMRNLCFSRSIAFKFLVVGFNILVVGLRALLCKEKCDFRPIEEGVC